MVPRTYVKLPDVVTYVCLPSLALLGEMEGGDRAKAEITGETLPQNKTEIHTYMYNTLNKQKINFKAFTKHMEMNIFNNI